MSVVIEEAINKYLDNLVIKPENFLYRCWQFVIGFASVLSGYLYMYMACFRTGWKFYFWIEALFAFDMILTFFV